MPNHRDVYPDDVQSLFSDINVSLIPLYFLEFALSKDADRSASRSMIAKMRGYLFQLVNIGSPAILYINLDRMISTIGNEYS